MSELDVRASDAEREQVALALRDARAEGRLTLEELSGRLERLYRTATRAELEELTRDLPPAPVQRRRRSTRLTVSLFGDVERRGRWRLGRHTLAVCGFGDLDLDLRQAELDGDEATVWVLVAFGNADVYVPEAAETDAGGIAVFGHRREWGRDAAAPNAPCVRVRVLSLFGTADVWRVPAGLTGRYRDIIQAIRKGER